MQNNNKSELRKKYLEIRSKIDKKQEKSNIIFERVIKTNEFKEANVIALYKALSSEVNTDKLIDYSLKNGKIVCLPRVDEDNLAFYTVNSSADDLEKSGFGVEEPKRDENHLVQKELIDLVIVPGVAFDKDCNRVGFGKGYYDRFLEKTNLKTIAIAFDEQIVEEGIQANDYDVKMDSVISENRMITKKIYKDRCEYEKGM